MKGLHEKKKKTMRSSTDYLCRSSRYCYIIQSSGLYEVYMILKCPLKRHSGYCKT